MATTPIEFYFDPVSPYAWLAVEQVDKIEQAGGRIVCRPVLFAALLNAFGNRGPAEIPAKRAYVLRDVIRQAKRLGLPFRGPPCHPFNPLAALRAIHAVEDEAQRMKLASHLLKAVWREGVDVGDPDCLHGTLASGGFDADALCAAVATPQVKFRLREATQKAIDTGIFGVPTFRLRDELFWGSDRVEAMVWALKGGAIDDALYRDVLDRPTGAVR